MGFSFWNVLYYLCLLSHIVGNDAINVGLNQFTKCMTKKIFCIFTLLFLRVDIISLLLALYNRILSGQSSTFLSSGAKMWNLWNCVNSAMRK